MKIDGDSPHNETPLTLTIHDQNFLNRKIYRFLSFRVFEEALSSFEKSFFVEMEMIFHSHLMNLYRHFSQS